MAQFVNLLTNEGLSLPTDLWLPSTARIRPQESWQSGCWTGHVRHGRANRTQPRGYYKEMDGLLSYKEGASFLSDLSGNWEDQVTQGIGNSYGMEALVKKVDKTSVGSGTPSAGATAV